MEKMDPGTSTAAKAPCDTKVEATSSKPEKSALESGAVSMTSAKEQSEKSKASPSLNSVDPKSLHIKTETTYHEDVPADPSGETKSFKEDYTGSTLVEKIKPTDVPPPDGDLKGGIQSERDIQDRPESYQFISVDSVVCVRKEPTCDQQKSVPEVEDSSIGVPPEVLASVVTSAVVTEAALTLSGAGGQLMNGSTKVSCDTTRVDAEVEQQLQRIMSTVEEEKPDSSKHDAMKPIVNGELDVSPEASNIETSKLIDMPLNNASNQKQDEVTLEEASKSDFSVIDKVDVFCVEPVVVEDPDMELRTSAESVVFGEPSQTSIVGNKETPKTNDAPEDTANVPEMRMKNSCALENINGYVQMADSLDDDATSDAVAQQSTPHVTNANSQLSAHDSVVQQKNIVNAEHSTDLHMSLIDTKPTSPEIAVAEKTTSSDAPKDNLEDSKKTDNIPREGILDVSPKKLNDLNRSLIEDEGSVGISQSSPQSTTTETKRIEDGKGSTDVAEMLNETSQVTKGERPAETKGENPSGKKVPEHTNEMANPGGPKGDSEKVKPPPEVKQSSVDQSAVQKNEVAFPDKTQVESKVANETPTSKVNVKSADGAEKVQHENKSQEDKEGKTCVKTPASLEGGETSKVLTRTENRSEENNAKDQDTKSAVSHTDGSTQGKETQGMKISKEPEADSKSTENIKPSLDSPKKSEPVKTTLADTCRISAAKPTTCDVGVGLEPRMIRVAAGDGEAEEVDGQQATAEVEISDDTVQPATEEENNESAVALDSSEATDAADRASSGASGKMSQSKSPSALGQSPSVTPSINEDAADVGKSGSATSRSSIPEPIQYEPPERKKSAASEISRTKTPPEEKRISEGSDAAPPKIEEENEVKESGEGKGESSEAATSGISEEKASSKPNEPEPADKIVDEKLKSQTPDINDKDTVEETEVGVESKEESKAIAVDGNEEEIQAVQNESVEDTTQETETVAQADKAGKSAEGETEGVAENEGVAVAPETTKEEKSEIVPNGEINPEVTEEDKVTDTAADTETQETHGEGSGAVEITITEEKVQEEKEDKGKADGEEESTETAAMESVEKADFKEEMPTEKQPKESGEKMMVDEERSTEKEEASEEKAKVDEEIPTEKEAAESEEKEEDESEKDTSPDKEDADGQTLEDNETEEKAPLVGEDSPPPDETKVEEDNRDAVGKGDLENVESEVTNAEEKEGEEAETEDREKFDTEDKEKAETEVGEKAEEEEKVDAEGEEKTDAETEDKTDVETEENPHVETEEKTDVETSEKIEAETEEKNDEIDEKTDAEIKEKTDTEANEKAEEEAKDEEETKDGEEEAGDDKKSRTDIEVDNTEEEKAKEEEEEEEEKEAGDVEETKGNKDEINEDAPPDKTEELDEEKEKQDISKDDQIEKPDEPPKSPVKRIKSPDKVGKRGVSPLSSPPKSSKSPSSPKKPHKSSSPKKKNGMLSPIKTPKTPGADGRKLPPIKAPVGLAPNPNLKNIKSKIGSFDNIKYKPGGGDKKVISKKLDWKAGPKIGSLDNATFKPGTGGADSKKQGSKERGSHGGKGDSKDASKLIADGQSESTAADEEEEGATAMTESIIKMDAPEAFSAIAAES